MSAPLVYSIHHLLGNAVVDVDRRDGPNGDPVILVDHLVDPTVVELGHLEEQAARISVPEPRVHIPFEALFEVFERVGRAVLGRFAARTPHAKRRHSVPHHATDPQRVQVTEVVGVKVPDEYLVQEVVGNLEGRNALGRAGPDVEQELVAVSELDQPTGGRLLRTCVRHSRSARRDAHLIRVQRLGARIVDVAVLDRARGRDRLTLLRQDGSGLQSDDRVGIGGVQGRRRQPVDPGLLIGAT